VQILILYFAVYSILRYVRGTRSAQMLLGGGMLIVVLLLITYLLSFDVLSYVIYFLLGYMAIILIVVFQNELRRVLALLVGRTLFPKTISTRQMHVPEELSLCIQKLASRQIGALIAVERGISLAGYEDTGIRLDALVSHELLVSLLTPPLPLHDGGIIIRNGRIAAAHCLFPISNQYALNALGMRHRAAVGLSEETDAVIVAVSEETGVVSVACSGKLHRYPENSEKRVLRWLRLATLGGLGLRTRPATFTEWLGTAIARRWQGIRAQPTEDAEHESAGDIAGIVGEGAQPIEEAEHEND
jgi:diadenylate cyclase